MQNTPKKIELLAPAKNKQIAMTAINSGADAIYVGYEKFGARNAAGNSLDDIAEIVKYAHIFNVKVYVTLNTILYNDEINEAKKLIEQLYDLNVDGIIIQDMGILELDLPPIPIIASTQYHNNTLEKIQFLEKTGFKRVILPREFSIEDIKNISKNTTVEIESFVHGALCVSYSGQCYLSCAIGGRSANRGECAQPCRKKYSLIDEKGNFLAKDKYLLSLKDFNLSNHLKEMILAGVTSFKIEGRLKDEAYIKNVVSYYRKALDPILEELNMQKSSTGTIIHNFEPSLEKTFNRGYTTYFLKSRSKNISALNYSKSLGEYIGKVKEVSKNYFCIDKNKLNVSDGICFFNQKNELVGTKIKKIENDKIFPNSLDGITKDTKIYRNYDHIFETQDLKKPTIRKIITSIELSDSTNGFVVKISDENNISSEIIIENNFEKAQSREKAINTIEKQLSKTGDTEFLITDVIVNMENIPFIAVSELNSIRRTLIKKHRETRALSYEKQTRTEKIQITPYPYKILSYEANVSNQKSKLFYEKRGVEKIELAAEKQKSLKDKKVMTTKHCLKYLFDLCPKNNNKKKSDKLYLIDEYNKKYRIEFDCKNCGMEIFF